MFTNNKKYYQNGKLYPKLQLMSEHLEHLLYNPVKIKNNGSIPTNFNTVQVFRLFVNRSWMSGYSIYFTRAVKMPSNRFSSNYGEAYGSIEIASGMYTFVILAKNPDIIYCGKREDVMGHFSLSRGSDVFFAGEIHFYPNGYLKYWTNDSGHYTPSADLYRVNIHPVLRDILPSRFFRTYDCC